MGSLLSTAADEEENEVRIPRIGEDSFDSDADDSVDPHTDWINQIKEQNYEKIVLECTNGKKMWEDPLMPAAYSSVYLDGRPRFPLQWKRPGELVPKPEFIKKGATRFDVIQGELGDCWLLAALAAVAQRKELLNKVVPDWDRASFQAQRGPNVEISEWSQKWMTKWGISGQDYCGVFRFRFYHFGEWIEVCVDDRLPSLNGRLLMVHSEDPSEFWAALLEKAYAKLFGCYEALKGGVCCDALTDLTGGISENLVMAKKDLNFIKSYILSALKTKALLCTGLWGDGSGGAEVILPNGLASGHAYTVTGLRKVTYEQARNDLYNREERD